MSGSFIVPSFQLCLRVNKVLLGSPGLFPPSLVGCASGWFDSFRLQKCLFLHYLDCSHSESLSNSRIWTDVGKKLKHASDFEFYVGFSSSSVFVHLQ